MPKRSWVQVEGAQTQSPTSKRLSLKSTTSIDKPVKTDDSDDSPQIAQQNGSHSDEATDLTNENRATKSRRRAPSACQSDAETVWPSLTRKVKACAACRKQKIRCDMDEDGPPCKRCKERNMPCKLNKSLQTLIEEESKWRATVSHDLAILHSALGQTLRALRLPPLPPLQTPLPDSADGEVPSISPAESVESKPGSGYESSPLQWRRSSEDVLAQVPIESLYEITRLRSLRGETVEEDHSRPDDFISRGAIRIEDAQRLFEFYQTHLDPYIYCLAAKYKTLDSLRRSSSILTACICAVAACHSEPDTALYDVCNQEFRRLVSTTIFDRRMSLDYLRALVIGTYWLSDVSWTLAGFAIRRASDIDLHKFYFRILDSSNGPVSTPNSWDPSDPEASIDPVRLWYLLYICDQHLSILYTRPPMIREDETIRGWRGYLESPHATPADVRISSQVALMILLSQVRELFGVDATRRVPREYVTHIEMFSRQLDQWQAHWAQKLQPNEHIGNFPSKGVQVHYHFGKLHLFSHVFRGLKSADHLEPIPPYFRDAAAKAVSHATTILELLLHDAELRRSIVGVPHYFHTMVAFACVVLVKVSDRYREELKIDAVAVHSLIRQIINLLRENNCSRHHLIHWMAEGLGKLLDSASLSFPSPTSTTTPSIATPTYTFNSNNNTNADNSNKSIAAPPVSSWQSLSPSHSLLDDGIPEQPTFPSVDPLLQMDATFGSSTPGHTAAADPSWSGPFLPVFEGADGECELTDFSFNFV
ncbi:hypothetical protein VTN49DRAFT_6386 [Thermomyces lanuginosus]|uniref:uncharacterized protein n=1 Tax=Thermomyces lanuginosus TaxID=5541 RepID=UPI003743E65F